MNRAVLPTLLIVLLATAGTAAAQTVAIQGATVHTKPGTSIEGATVVVRNGRITAVGKNVAVPKGATVIDARGKVVTAGFIESSSALGLQEVELVAETSEGSFGGGRNAIFAAYRVTDGFNPRSVSIPLARTGGVTSVVSKPRGGLVSGRSAWMALRAGTTADMTVRGPLAMHANLGEAALSSARGSRGMALLALRELLDDAREYRKRRNNFERNQTRRFATSRLNLEALIPVIQGRMPLVISAHRSSDILSALALEKEFGARIIIEGGTEAWMVAGELAKTKAAVILDPVANLPSGFDRLHVREDNAERLAAAGVPIAISSLGSASNVRKLRQRAGIAIGWGLSPDVALAAVTTGPASIFGIRDRGTVERGKVADIVVWSGDPFELSTRAERVFIGGVEQSLDSRQRRLMERYRTLPVKN